MQVYMYVCAYMWGPPTLFSEAGSLTGTWSVVTRLVSKSVGWVYLSSSAALATMPSCVFVFTGIEPSVHQAAEQALHQGPHLPDPA